MPEPLEAPPEHDDSYLDIPIHQLPPLPERGQRYRVEPFFAVCVVGTYVITFVVLVNLCVFLDGIEPLSGKVPALALIWTWAAIAVVSSAYILVGDPGEIKRGPDTCYPMPQEVRDRLLRKESLTGLGNLPGPEGHPKLGSYCIRCLVWRPPTKRDSATPLCLPHARPVPPLQHLPALCDWIRSPLWGVRTMYRPPQHDTFLLSARRLGPRRTYRPRGLYHLRDQLVVTGHRANL
eukprot:TRINITY_DN26827_c0_g1_i1.p1 TRINITY_DN26827_c0_g1~~TRINITY_DN26827_c0_g1_i1.p1  ORF type:complete len:259 (+),score=24.38 TRINITY_DN26827_c0_g1_i1:75-779(+)